MWGLRRTFNIFLVLTFLCYSPPKFCDSYRLTPVVVRVKPSVFFQHYKVNCINPSVSFQHYKVYCIKPSVSLNTIKFTVWNLPYPSNTIKFTVWSLPYPSNTIKFTKITVWNLPYPSDTIKFTKVYCMKPSVSSICCDVNYVCMWLAMNPVTVPSNTPNTPVITCS